VAEAQIPERVSLTVINGVCHKSCAVRLLANLKLAK